MINTWDGTITDWIGPFSYHANVRFTHVYTEEGTYQLSVKAKDDPNLDEDHSDGLESLQADSYVQVPIFRPKYGVFLFKIIQMFPILKQFII